jgi:hypothetical protein
LTKEENSVQNQNNILFYYLKNVPPRVLGEFQAGAISIYIAGSGVKNIAVPGIFET